MSARSWVLWCGFAVGLGLADQLTKQLALERLFNGAYTLLPVLEFRLAFNPGAAFGLLGGALPIGADPRLVWNNLLLCALAVGIGIVFAVWLRRSAAISWQALGLACVMGGALGNLIDRIHYGFVVDFISVHWRNWYFPSFNLADMAISFGVAVLLWVNWRAGGGR